MDGLQAWRRRGNVRLRTFFWVCGARQLPAAATSSGIRRFRLWSGVNRRAFVFGPGRRSYGEGSNQGGCWFQTGHTHGLLPGCVCPLLVCKGWRKCRGQTHCHSLLCLFLGFFLLPSATVLCCHHVCVNTLLFLCGVHVSGLGRVLHLSPNVRPGLRLQVRLGRRQWGQRPRSAGGMSGGTEQADILSVLSLVKERWKVVSVVPPGDGTRCVCAAPTLISNANNKPLFIKRRFCLWAPDVLKDPRLGRSGVTPLSGSRCRCSTGGPKIAPACICVREQSSGGTCLALLHHPGLHVGLLFPTGITSCLPRAALRKNLTANPTTLSQSSTRSCVCGGQWRTSWEFKSAGGGSADRCESHKTTVFTGACRHISSPQEWFKADLITSSWLSLSERAEGIIRTYLKPSFKRKNTS